jgi:hypothetical protein
VKSDQQVYVTEQHDQPVPPGGPGLTFTAFTPDMHHFAGRGGRVLPLYASADTSSPNLAPGFLDLLSLRLGAAVQAEDVLAYVAAITSHPDFTELFVEDLRTPGIRVPLTADKEVWDQAVAIGRRVLWLHTRGERYEYAQAGRSRGAPEVSDTKRRPLVKVAIPGTPELYPDELTYDSETKTLFVGEGQVAPVAQEVIDYQVSGMNVLRKWFGYRRATRPQARGEQSALDDVRPKTWPSAYTTDLLELLRVLTLVTELEPAQAELLTKVMATERITVADLTDAGVLPVPKTARSPLPKVSRSDKGSGEQLGLGLS